MTRPAVALLVMATVLAGCGDGPSAATDDIVVVSGQTATDAPTVAPTPKGGEVGHIAGYVVDDALKPVRGARVQVTSLDLVDITDRNGAFEFIDLAPGAYLLRFNATGHQDAESVLDVKADRFTRAKVILHRIPPPEPRIEVQKFQGFAEVTQTGIILVSGLSECDCTFDLQQEVDDLGATVVEATMEPADNGENGFWVRLVSQECCTTYSSVSLPNPYWVQIDGTAFDQPDLRIYATLWSRPVPEINKEFEVFVSSFYNTDVPAGYSILAPA